MDISPSLTRAHVEAILVDDTSPLVTLISNLLSTSFLERLDALHDLEQRIQVDPDRLFINLGRVLQDCQDAGIRTFTAILIGKHLVQNNLLMWNRLTSENRMLLKSILLRCVQQEKDRCVMMKLCDTISVLASRIPHTNGRLSGNLIWPEFFSFIRMGLSSRSPSEAALRIFAQLPTLVLGSLGTGTDRVTRLTHINDVFLQILNNKSLSPDLKIAVLRAVMKFISCLSSSEDTDIFQDLVTPIMSKTKVVMGEDETNGEEALRLLIGTDPNFLMKKPRPSFVVLGSAIEMAETNILEEGTRHLAIDLMIKLIESAPANISELPQFIRRFLSLMLKMMLDIEDEPGWYTSSSEESSNYYVAKQCLSRLATALGGYSIFSVASELLGAYLTASDWEKNHAALIALAEISNGCSKVMNDNIELVASMAISSAQNRHPRVRWDAANAICHLAEDCSSFQVQYRQRVQTALAPVMNGQDYPRVQERAADAYRRFRENSTAETTGSS